MNRPPDLESLYATLTGEPLCLTFEAIGRLTDRQIYDVLLYPREKDGSLKAKSGRGEETTLDDLPPTKENQRIALFAMGRGAGIAEEELERIWREKYPEDD